MLLRSSLQVLLQPWKDAGVFVERVFRLDGAVTFFRVKDGVDGSSLALSRCRRLRL